METTYKCKICIVGACGYIGSMFYKANSSLYDITCYDRSDEDIYPPHSIKRASEISTQEIQLYNVIIFLAGITRKIFCENEEFDSVYDMNVRECISIVKKMNNSQLLIYASTASLYYNQPTSCNESCPLNIDIMGSYERSMYLRELEINMLGKNTIGLRMGTVIGISSTMRYDLLYNSLYYSAFSFTNIQVWDPDSWRCILGFDDLNNILQRLISKKNIFTSSTILNVGSFNVQIREAAKDVAARTDSKITIHGGNSSIGFRMDYSKICKLLEYTPQETPDTIFRMFVNNKMLLLDMINNQPNKISKCLICSNTHLGRVVDLGLQPLANEYITDTTVSEKKFPLKIYRCKYCFHTQLSYIVSREDLFKNYIYESGTSNTIKAYFKSFAERYTNKIKILANKPYKALEIACNDGSQLDEFKRLGWDTYGVDPASNLVIKAAKKGHIVEEKFWAKDSSNFKGPFDIIIAQNVIAHVTNPVQFLQHCVSVMDDESTLVVQTSQANMYKNNEFDTIYHEHISFFTIKSMIVAANNAGASVVNVYKHPIHGVSYIFEIKKGIQQVILPHYDEEDRWGYYSDSLYTEYEKYIHLTKKRSLEIFISYKSKGYTILAYGAAAKGNVFLNYIFDSSPHSCAPECIFDDSSLKWDKVTAGTRIPVKSIENFKNYADKDICIIILAWNFADEIKQRIEINRKNHDMKGKCVCISFFPVLSEEVLTTPS